MTWLWMELCSLQSPWALGACVWPTWEVSKVFRKTVNLDVPCRQWEDQYISGTLLIPLLGLGMETWGPGFISSCRQSPNKPQAVVPPKIPSEDKIPMPSETALQGSMCQLLHTFLGAAPYQEEEAMPVARWLRSQYQAVAWNTKLLPSILC